MAENVGTLFGIASQSEEASMKESQQLMVVEIDEPSFSQSPAIILTSFHTISKYQIGLLIRKELVFAVLPTGC